MISVKPFALTLAAALLSTSLAGAAPMRVSLPAYERYCVTSNPLDASKYDLPEIREQLFDTLYDQIEKEALKAGLQTIGVPFVDVINKSTPPATAAPTPAAEPTVTVKECAVIPTTGATSLPAAGLESIPAHDVYAMLCQADQIEACQRDLETLLRSQNPAPSDMAKRIIFRTRQAFSTNTDGTSLVSALTDAKVLALRDDAPKTSPPGQTVVVSAELAPGS